MHARSVLLWPPVLSLHGCAVSDMVLQWPRMWWPDPGLRPRWHGTLRACLLLRSSLPWAMCESCAELLSCRGLADKHSQG